MKNQHNKKRKKKLKLFYRLASVLQSFLMLELLVLLAFEIKR